MFHYGKSADANFFAHLSSHAPLQHPATPSPQTAPPIHHPPSPREESKAWQIVINERGGKKKRWRGDNAGAPAPPLAGKRRKRWWEREGCSQTDQVRKEGRDGGGVWVMVRKADYLSNYYYHFRTSCPRSAPCFILRSLSPLCVMSGSNWWILLTFAALHFHACVHLYARVRATGSCSGYVHYNIPSHSIQHRKHS